MGKPTIHFEDHEHAQRCATDLGNLVEAIENLGKPEAADLNEHAIRYHQARMVAFIPRLQTLHAAILKTALNDTTDERHEHY